MSPSSMTKGILFVLFSVSILNESRSMDMAPAEEDTSYWQMAPTMGLFFSQHSFSEYYKGGGINSVALGNYVDIEANYQKAAVTWENEVKMRYGVIKTAAYPIQKNEDHLEFNSKYGYSFSDHLQMTGLFNFTTRIHDVYELKKTGEQGKLIGNFMAPAYINLGSGIDYKTKDKALSIFYSPVNSKVTIVNDEELIPQYLGNYEGGNTRYELGSLLKFELKTNLMENISVHSIGSFFTNHLGDFGKIDVNWENKVKFKVNKFFSVNFLTHIVYDEDILFDIPTEGDNTGGEETTHKGPRTQFKEMLNIGLSHTF